MPMTEKKSRDCPYCGKPAQFEGNPYRPFCSERCKLIDLGNWASGSYRVPGERVSQPEDKEDKKEPA